MSENVVLVMKPHFHSILFFILYIFFSSHTIHQSVPLIVPLGFLIYSYVNKITICKIK